jgi:hypothetical protein
MALRTQMDLKYGDMSVDLMTGRVTLTDVKMWPLPKWDTDGNCEVGIDRMTIRTGALDQTDRIRVKLQIAGASATAECVPPEAQQGMAMAGLESISMPRLTVDLDYGVPGSDALVRVFGDVDKVAAVDLTAKFAYVWMDGRRDMEQPDPVVFLSHATLSVENKGIWQAMQGQLPPPLTDVQGAPLFVEGALGSALTGMNRSNGGEGADPSALTDSQTAFLESVKTTWPAFLASPATLVLETGFSGDTYVDFKAMEDDPRVVFDTLKPRLELAAARTTRILPAAMISQAMSPQVNTMAAADRKAVGIALLTGEGAPRNLSAGYDLLTPLALGGDADAALVLSRALENVNPDEAYNWALVAGRNGAAGATALLDRLENQLGFVKVLALQNKVSATDSHSKDALQTIAGIREQAAMRLSGKGQARSYGIAAMWASLAKAAGDPEAADILGDVDEHVRLSGADSRAAWLDAEKAASALAMQVWIGQDLPARFSR